MLMGANIFVRHTRRNPSDTRIDITWRLHDRHVWLHRDHDGATASRCHGTGPNDRLRVVRKYFPRLDEIAPRYARDGFVREAEGTGTVNACPHGHFPSGDGKFLAIACTTDKMFERLTEAMARPDLLERFGDQANRLAGRDIVLAEVEAWTKSMPRDQVIAICTDHGVPAGAVNSIADIFADPHFKERGTLTTIDVPGIGPITVPAALPRLSETPGEVKTLGPTLGNANKQIYGDELGLSEDQQNELKEQGII